MKQSILQLSSKDLKGKSGVYMISNNGRNYIGSSKSLYDRLLEHRNKLLKGVHPNDFLQNVYNKHGINDFEYQILEFCIPENRVIREKYYIDALKPEFNLQLDPILKTLSLYSKQKLGKSIKQGKLLGKYKTKFDFSKVEMYDYLGRYIKSFKDKDDCSKQLNISTKKVQQLASNYVKGFCYKGIRLRYKDSKTKISEFNINSNYLGKHYDFYKVDSDQKEIFAFNSIKNVWNFFYNEIINGNTEFKIKIKLKKSNESPKIPLNGETPSERTIPC